MHLDDGRAQRLTDKETHRDQTPFPLRRRVDILHPGNLVHDSFKWTNRQVRYLLGRGTGILYEDIDHRDRDLRIFLARREKQCQDPDGQGRHHQQGGEWGVNEYACQASGYTQRGSFLNGQWPMSTYRPTRTIMRLFSGHRIAPSQTINPNSCDFVFPYIQE